MVSRQTPDGPACHSNGYEQDRRYLTRGFVLFVASLITFASEEVRPWILILAFRAGIVSIVICLAVGIASIFSFNAIRIIFSIICMYVCHAVFPGVC